MSTHNQMQIVHYSRNGDLNLYDRSCWILLFGCTFIYTSLLLMLQLSLLFTWFVHVCIIGIVCLNHTAAVIQQESSQK